MRLFIILLSIWMAIVPAKAGQMSLLGAGAPPSGGTTYQGPGDVVSGATVFGSCARVYTAALATSSTLLCDLVAVTGGAAVCTLQATTTGFVDLAGSYCPGSLTPAAACAAASGGSCKVTKVYDQTGTGNHFTQAVLGSMPAFNLSGLNSLPSMRTTSAGASILTSVTSFTQSNGFTWSGVTQRTGNIANPNNLIGSSAADTMVGWSGTGLARCGSSGGLLTAAATESVYHSLSCVVVNSANGALNVDGTDTTGVTGTGSFAAATMRVMRTSGGSSTTGDVMEFMFYPNTISSGQRSLLSGNQHSTNGYNF